MDINRKLIVSVNNSLLHFLILFTILTYLFFSTIVKEEGNTINKVLLDIIDKTFSENNLNANWKLTFSDKLEYQILLASLGITRNNYNNYIDTIQKTKNEVKELNNSTILNKALLIIFFVTIIVLILNILPRLFGFSPKINIIEIIIVFSFLGLVEYIFYSHITKHFRPLLPSEILNYMKIKLLSKFQAYNI